MKQLLFLCTAIFLLSAGCQTPSKYMKYTEVRNDLISPSISSILIVGSGSSGTNVFLETLSTELNRRLKAKNITATFHHLGNNQKEAIRTFNEIRTKTKYDAVLHFVQLDETRNPLVLTQSAGGGSLAGGGSYFYAYAHQSIRFQQQFMMRYFDFDNISHSRSDVRLDIKIDFLSIKEYAGLCDNILATLKIEPLKPQKQRPPRRRA